MNQAHRHVLMWARTLHVYLTLFGLALLLLFAVTGFMLNHEEWFLPRQTTNGVIPVAWLAAPAQQEQIVDKLRDDFAIAGELESFEPIDGDATFRVVFKADEGRAVATIHRASGETEVIHEANLSRERVRIVEGTMPLELLTPDDPSKQLPIVERLRKDFGTRGEVNSAPRYEKESESFQVVFKAPGYLATATIRASDGQTRVVHQSRGLAGILLDLHRGKDSGLAWSIVIDGLAILFVVVSITGFILWTSLRARGKKGGLILVAGTVVGFAIYYAFVPR